MGACATQISGTDIQVLTLSCMLTGLQASRRSFQHVTAGRAFLNMLQLRQLCPHADHPLPCTMRRRSRNTSPASVNRPVQPIH